MFWVVRKRAEYCFESTVSEKRTHWASLSFGANSVSSAKNSVSSLLPTNNRLKGTQWVRSPELSEPRKTHWVWCLKPCSPKLYTTRFRAMGRRSYALCFVSAIEPLAGAVCFVHCLFACLFTRGGHSIRRISQIHFGNGFFSEVYTPNIHALSRVPLPPCIPEPAHLNACRTARNSPLTGFLFTKTDCLIATMADTYFPPNLRLARYNLLTPNVRGSLQDCTSVQLSSPVVKKPLCS